MTDMSGLHDRIGDWLDAGPATAPHDLLEDVLTRLSTTRQRHRRGRWVAPLFRVGTVGMAAAAVVVAAVVVTQSLPPGVGTNLPPATPGWANRFPQETASLFARPFTYAIDPSSGLTLAFSEPGTEVYQFRVPAPGAPSAAPTFVRGVIVRSAGEGLRADACRQTGGELIRDPTPRQFIDYLATVPGVVLSEPSTTTVDGRQAITINVQLETTPPCEKLWIFQSDCGCAFTDASFPRHLLALGVDGELVVIQMFTEDGDLEGWLPTGQAFVDSIHFITK